MTDALQTVGLVLLGAALALVPTCLLYILQTTRVAVSEQRAQADVWRSIAQGAVVALETTVDAQRSADGLAPMVLVAPVEPEHSSPVSALQRAVAEMATWRARLVAAELQARGQVPPGSE